MKHGGNLHDAKALFPEAPQPWLDLSTGINPHSYPLALDDPAVFQRLPAVQDVAALEAIAAHAYGVPDPARIAAAPGTQAIIHLLPRLRAASRVAVIGPTYSEHQACWAAAGHETVEVPTLASALALTPDVIVVVNPNNPDGRVVPATELEAASAILAARGGWLIVDEAFADFEGGVSVARRMIPATIVLRSFGKTYGLAGLRLGFAIGDPAFMSKVRTAFGLWAISGPALKAGAAALADRDWLMRQKAELRQAVNRLDSLLGHKGFSLEGGTSLFRLFRHKDAPAWFERLAAAGIWVRKFPHDGELLRLGIPGPDGMTRLEKALSPQL